MPFMVSLRFSGVGGLIHNTSTLPQGRFVVGRQSSMLAAQKVRREGTPPKMLGSIQRPL
jgi:hypothetical protein